MKSPASLVLFLALFAGVAGAAVQRWADRLNAAQGETLLWLEAEVAAEEPAGGPAVEGGEGGVEEAAGDPAPPPPPKPEEGAAAAPEAPVPESASPAPADAGEGAPASAGAAPGMEPPPPPPSDEAAAKPKDRFAALVLPFLTPQPQGGVILLHDRGGHPDWPGVIAPLRQGLPDHGWATLSIEYPAGVADPKRRLRQAVKRIEAALRFFNQRQLFNVVLIGHGEGALAATAYLADNPRPGISGYVALGLPVPPEGVGGLLLLEGVRVPMLELFGERDRREVVVGAREREQAVLRGGNTQYRQQLIPGADHFFAGMEPALVELVRRWLKRYSSGMEIKLGSREGRAIRKSLGLTHPTGLPELDGAAVDEGGRPAGDVELDDAP